MTYMDLSSSNVASEVILEFLTAGEEPPIIPQSLSMAVHLNHFQFYHIPISV